MGKVDDKRQQKSEHRWNQLMRQDPRRPRKIHCEIQFPGNIALGNRVIRVKPRRIRKEFVLPRNIYALERSE